MPTFRCWITYALAACAVATAACADADRGAAAMRPSIRLSRNPVPLGGPVDVTLQFDVPPGIPPFAEDYRVLLRFLFDDGEVMASYDHDPPTPTRKWQSGTTVMYTRRLFVPAIPYVGDAPILVGLYSPASGERLHLSGKDQGKQTYKMGTLTLQAPRCLLFFNKGWYRTEESAATHTEWRWTQSEASITTENPRQDSVLYLRVDGRPDLFETPQQVSVSRGDRILQRFSVASGETTDHELALNAGDLGVEDELTLTLKVDKTFVPAWLPGQGSDTRTLGIRVYNASLEPRSQP